MLSNPPSIFAGRAARAALCLLLAAGLLACADQATPPAAGNAGDTPQRGGQVILAFSADIAGINPLIVPSNRPTESVLRHVYLQLMREQADFETGPPTFEPDLARSWEWSEDGLTVTFHLRDDAVWSDGEPVDADDVRFSWIAQTHPDVAWDTAYFKDEIADVEVVDPHTVRFHFHRVNPTQLLEINESYILPEHVFGQVPFAEWRSSGQWFRDHAVYAGPFVIASWTPQQEVVLARNERYYDPDLPYLDRVVVRIIPDQTNQLTQLLAGSVDVVGQLSPDNAGRIEQVPNLRLVRFWGPSFIYLAWNTRRPLLADPEVRRALTLGIDRQTLVDNIWGELGRVSSSPLLASTWAYDRSLEPYGYAPDEARRRLAALGWEDHDGDGVLDRDGEPFAFELATNSDNQQRIDATVLIQSQLARIGVAVEPRALEFQSFVTRINRGDYDAMVMGWTMPTNYDYRFAFHSDEIDGGNNFVAYSNPEVDRLLDEIRAQRTLADTKPLLAELQQTLHRELPYTFLWESQRMVGLNRRVRGAEPNVLYVHFNLPEWWVEPGS